MHALEPYMKTSAPGHTELVRKFGPSQEQEDQHLRRLVITLDPTITSIGKSPDYRARQAGVFIGFRNDEIATMFSYARVVTCDALPRVDRTSGTFENTMRVWVREDDVESARALIAQQRWISKVEPEATHIVRAVEREPLRLAGVAARPSREEARPSL